MHSHFRILVGVFGLPIALSCTRTQAWNSTGHKTFTLIAWRQLAEGQAKVSELQGTWKLKEITLDGKPFAAGEITGAIFTFAGDVLVIDPAQQDNIVFPKQKLRFAIRPDRKPKAIDTENLDGPDKGKEIAGIYKVVGDVLSICIATKGNNRPTDFTSREGSSRALYTLERARRQ
jgi:uncharacterized protein (TIGR03067 family)